MSWSSVPTRLGHTKINACVKTDLYDWILQHPQALQSPIAKYFLIVSTDGHSGKEMVKEHLLQMSSQESHNRMVSPT